MKREILCPVCTDKVRSWFPSDNPYPGEHVKFYPGKAKKAFICDLCSELITLDEDCTAFTAWAVGQGIPYHPWESDFIRRVND